MVPIPAEYMPNFWNQISSECPMVTLSCLLPNGILVLLEVKYSATLADIKEDLWYEAAKFPLYGKLQADPSQYIFKIFNFLAEEEELNDENRRLCDIRPTGGVLNITECRLNSVEHSINVSIGHLIGKSLQEFDALNSAEINDFRFYMRKLAEDKARNRCKKWKEKLLYQFPLRISAPMLNEMQNITTFRVETKCEYVQGILEPEQPEILKSSFQFDVQPTDTPDQLLERVLAKKMQVLKIKNETVPQYVLKVCGREEYLLDHPLIEFQYIQECLSDNVTPSLLTVPVERIPDVHNEYDYVDSVVLRESSANTLRKKKAAKSSWNITKDYGICIGTVSKLNCDNKKEIGIQVGLFHGGRPLCQTVKSELKSVSDSCEVTFDSPFDFEIKVCNIPRNAKLCFVVYEINKYSKGTKSRKPKDPKDNQMNPIAWANTSVYDFKGQLRTGSMTLYMWQPCAEEIMSDEVLHPLGTVVSNPDIDHCTALTLVFKSFAYDETVEYPSKQKILEYGKTMEPEHVPDLDEEMAENCRRLINDMENFYDVHDQDRKNLWRYRQVWMAETPGIFPKLLSCVDWDKRDEVYQVRALLSAKPRLPFEKCLELLDYAYADMEVRRFAVEGLTHISDEDLLLYLLQLVQAIKHELYLECSLVRFLIRKALANQRIGHYLFWHLRSEMRVKAVSVRFGLILEAYCRGSQEHMPALQRQLTSVEKLKNWSVDVKSQKDNQKAKAALKERLLNSDERDVVRCPLDPSYRCGKIRVDKCRVMDSKMRPLWVVYENSDVYGEDIHIIFKNGDDLRQDMLTLQMLRIMDRLWKQEDLDLRLNAYNCISLDNSVGMIQVVLNADTLANIQKMKNISLVGSFKRDSILNWLKEYNKDTLNNAIKEFTFSLAGYCVATYVLGIADRHSDNIMIKTNGQIFHIDFGHILGHFKKKFGIERERVPFVMSHDFVQVINGEACADPTKTLKFSMFQHYCEKAFLILRKHGNLIISLFAMMISTGLPELSSEKDLQYLRDTLVLTKTEDEALAHFKSKFAEATTPTNMTAVSLNFAIHNWAKSNKA